MTYYFGCESKSNIGHYLFKSDRQGVMFSDRGKDLPFRYEILDHCFVPGQLQSVAVLIDMAGYTILSMADRSADSRGGSCAAFFSKSPKKAGERSKPYTFEDMLKIAQGCFPKVYERISNAAPITLWEGC